MRQVTSKCLWLLLLSSALLGGVKAKADNITLSAISDATLKSCLTNYDSDADGILTETECQAVTDTLDISGSSSEGWSYIQNFTNIICLKFSNSTTSASAATTGIAQLTKLQKLVLDNNWTFETLDLSSNTALTYISCAGTPQKDGQAKTISGYTLQEYTYNTAFTQIVLPADVSQITWLDIHNNPAIFTNSTIDFSAMASLVHLDIDMTGYREDELPVSNLTNLEYLACGWKSKEQYAIYDFFSPSYYTSNEYKMDELLKGSYLNYIKVLDVSNLTKLKFLECNYNTLTAKTLAVSTLENLEHLECTNCNLTSLDFGTGLKKLNYLFCGNFYKLKQSYINSSIDYSDAWNAITGLDLSQCTALQTVRAEWMDVLASLNVTGCTKLTLLNAHDCVLTSLDLTTNTELDYLNCSNNKIPALDLSQNEKLCTGNATIEEGYCSVENQNIGCQKLYVSDGNLYIDMPDAVTATNELDKIEITINGTTTTYSDLGTVISENDDSGHRVYLLPANGNMQFFSYDTENGVGENTSVVYYYHTNGANVSGKSENKVQSMDVHMSVMAYVQKFKHQYATICLPYVYEVADTAYRLGDVDTENKTVTLKRVGYNFGARAGGYPVKGLPLIVKMANFVEGGDNYVVYNKWDKTAYQRSFLGETLTLTGVFVETQFDNNTVYVLGTNKQQGRMYGKQGIWLLRNPQSTYATVPAFRCYAPKPDDLDLAKGYTFVLDGTEVTGIDGLTDDTPEKDEGVWYTLAGVKLNQKPTAPGVYICNHKKIWVK